MSDFDVKFYGLTEYDGKLARIHDQLPAGMERLMKKSIIYAQSQIPAYPSPPAGSAYRRTGTMGRIITAFPGVSGGRNLGGGGGDNGGMPLTRVEPLGRDVRGVIGGRLSYMPYVIDEKEQAGQHKGRWYTLQKVIHGAKGGIIKVWRAGVLDMFK